MKRVFRRVLITAAVTVSILILSDFTGQGNAAAVLNPEFVSESLNSGLRDSADLKLAADYLEEHAQNAEHLLEKLADETGISFPAELPVDVLRIILRILYRNMGQ